MANTIHKFKDRDVKRIIKASRLAGLVDADYEVDPSTGKVRIITKSSTLAAGNSWHPAVAELSQPQPAESARPRRRAAKR